jgi:hypothetical protein
MHMRELLTEVLISQPPSSELTRRAAEPVAPHVDPQSARPAGWQRLLFGPELLSGVNPVAAGVLSGDGFLMSWLSARDGAVGAWSAALFRDSRSGP